MVRKTLPRANAIRQAMMRLALMNLWTSMDIVVSELEVDERSLCSGIGCTENKGKRDNERIKRPADISGLETQIL